MEYPGLFKETSVQTWDARSRVTSRKDGEGNTTAYEYDNANRLARIAYADGTETLYSVNASGDRVNELHADGTVVAQATDKLGRVYTIYQDQDIIAEYQYLGPAQVARRTMNIGGFRIDYGYDVRGRVASTTHTANPFGSGPVFDERTYAWDRNNSKT